MTAPEGHAARRRRMITYVMWGSLVLAMGATSWWYFARSTQGGGEVKYRCVPAGPRDIECVFSANRDAPGVCFDLVLPCDDGEHRARVCSGPLAANVAETVSVTDLAPPLPETPRCDPPRYSGAVTQPAQ